jgi:hypothetical protein
LSTFEGSAGLIQGLWPRHSRSSNNDDSADDILKVPFEASMSVFSGCGLGLADYLFVLFLIGVDYKIVVITTVDVTGS